MLNSRSGCDAVNAKDLLNDPVEKKILNKTFWILGYQLAESLI